MLLGAQGGSGVSLTRLDASGVPAGDPADVAVGLPDQDFEGRSDGEVAWATASGGTLSVARVRVEGRVELGLEAAARRARYEVYRACGADAVVLAHHADDQGETVLIQMLRGAGPAGLSAMPECRVLEGWPRILRPLLGTPRSELQAYAVGASLAWVDDDSNADTGHARNFLRHDVLPLIETRYPAWRATLARVAANGVARGPETGRSFTLRWTWARTIAGC